MEGVGRHRGQRGVAAVQQVALVVVVVRVVGVQLRHERLGGARVSDRHVVVRRVVVEVRVARVEVVAHLRVDGVRVGVVQGPVLVLRRQVVTDHVLAAPPHQLHLRGGFPRLRNRPAQLPLLHQLLPQPRLAVRSRRPQVA